MSRNVEALAEIIRDWEAQDSITARERGVALQHFLAARGVLAVDSLTDEQLLDFPFQDGDWSVGDPQWREASEVRRAALRRYATGDTE